MLSYELGNILTEKEAQDYIREIDTDGNGTVDFGKFCAALLSVWFWLTFFLFTEEFFNWWTSPSDAPGATERQKQVGALKLKLQAQVLFEFA